MTDTTAIPTNAPEITVSELSSALKRTLEDAFGYVRVRGEITGYRGPHSSGHCYFSLKDQNAKIDAVCWKGTYSRLKHKPEEGLEVIATGRITTFAGKSSYQIVVDSLEPAGVGALMALLEERKRKLQAEGLFDPARKRPIPYLPKVIGVVTSPTGSVIRDILHRLDDRFPRHVLVWPVRVQGETSAAEVAAAIRGFNALPEGGPVPRPDVLIVARGGGSLEDLWSFNEEVVVRAAAESRIPLVSAVGHETDTTLIDFASDRRAPTPTGAAEMVVPVRGELLAATADLGGRLVGGLTRLMERRRSELRAAGRALPSPDRLIGQPRQRLDLAAARLTPALHQAVSSRSVKLATLGGKLRIEALHQQIARQRDKLASHERHMVQCLTTRVHRARERFDLAAGRLRVEAIEVQITRQREKLSGFHGRMTRCLTAGVHRAGDRLTPLAARLTPILVLRPIDQHRQRLDQLWKLAGAYSHESVLERGFALVLDAEGHVVGRAAELATGAPVTLRFRDGEVGAVTQGAAAPKPATRTRPKAGQPDLFS